MTPRRAATTKAATKPNEPGTRGVDGQVTEIAAEKVDRAMREIDVAHQAEDQREAARDQEIKAAEGDPVEAGVEKKLLPPKHRLEARRPWSEDEPDQGDDDDHDDQRPDRTARDEAVHTPSLMRPPRIGSNLGRRRVETERTTRIRAVRSIRTQPSHNRAGREERPALVRSISTFCILDWCGSEARSWRTRPSDSPASDARWE